MNQERSFLRKVGPDRPAAVVLGGESTHGLAFVRSLGRRKIPVLAIGTSRRPAMWTRFGTTIVQPCEDGGESALVERLQSIGRLLPVKSVLIPCGDDYVLFLSRHRSELTPYYEFVIPDGQTVEMLVSKKSQYEHARKAGVPTPKTLLLTDDVEGDTLPYPCLLKPTYMHRWAKYQENMGIRNKAKVLVANAPEELAKHRPRIAESGLEWIAQELVEGSVDQLYAFYAYFDRDSTLLAAFVRRKLRQRPEFGAGCYSIGVREDEIVDLGARLLQPVGYRGLANVEFKRDAKDGQFKLIEINARSAAQASLPIDSGVDLPYIAYRDALRKPVQPVSSYRQGVKWVNLAGDFIAFLEHQRRGQLRLREWLSSLSDVRSYAYFAWDDPMPAVSMGLTAIKFALSGDRQRRDGRAEHRKPSAGGLIRVRKKGSAR